MPTEVEVKNSNSLDLNNLLFSDLFNLEDLQQLQDLFADAHEVASIITHPDGSPITSPSNFTRLCNEIIRTTEKGCANCYQSDAFLGSHNPGGPSVQPCLSGGLWDAGASITVGGKHIANWLIGQVRNEALNEEQMLAYADDIGVSRHDFTQALKEVPQMPLEKFNKIAQMLFAFANELSAKAFNNLKLKMQIVEREKAAAQLEESRKYLYTTLHSIGDGVISTDINGLIVSMNPVAENLCGWALVTAAGRPLTEVYHIVDAETHEMVTDPVKKVLEKGEIVGLADQTVLISKNGTEYQIADSAAPIKNQEGEITGVVLVFSDVSEQYAAQRQIKESEEKFRLLYTAMDQGLALHEIITDENGKPVDYVFLDINDSYTRLVGVTREMSIGKRIRELMPKVEQYWIDIFGKVALTGEPSYYENYLETNGKYYSTYSYSPKKNQFAVLVNDITERKKTEQELIKAKEKAEESDRLKSAFLANMSHEIRTPMNGILGFTQLLKEPELTGEEQKKFISIIEKSGARLLNIINDIVDMSKIEAGLMETNISEANMNEKIDFIYNFFKHEAALKKIHFTFNHLLPAKEAIIKTDPEKIYAILTNLVSNAMKFTHEGSIEFGYEKKGNYLEFYVKDTGIGISQQHKEIIFERFRQGDKLNSKNYEGTGLGLSISKSYVEMLGGTMWLESEYGKGAAFYFTIPYNVETEKKEVNKEDPSVIGTEPHVKNLKILIAEDDEHSEFLLTTIVKKISADIIIVRNGVEVVEACRNNPAIDLVLMDITMPELNGYEATRQIRAFNQNIIIIAQTAYALAGDREKAIEAGCNDYISKPLKYSLLLGLIQKYFNTFKNIAGMVQNK